MKLTLRRVREVNGATMGLLFVEGVEKPFHTLENAWLDNRQGDKEKGVQASCIPAGNYKCMPHGWEPNTTVDKPQTWQVMDVHGRTWVLIHIGNYLRDTLGCILVGLDEWVTDKISMVTSSTEAINTLRRLIGEQGFDLEVIATPHVAA